MTDIREQIRDYYSNITVNEGGQMATHTCSCGPSSMPPYMQMILKRIPEGITSRFYGCGSPLPPALEGCTVLDLGCGTGRDVYLASKLVGPKGRVIGLDMNKDQLAVAESFHAQMAEEWGYDNVEFRQGYIEDLEGIADGSIDVVISNCVVNLSPMKERVFSEVWRVLKNGGELYFSDIFVDRRLPEPLSSNPLLRGECLGGAMYIEDFRRLMGKLGWPDLRWMSMTEATIQNPEVEELVDGYQFVSATVRAIKLPDYLEDICEKYGNYVTYNGGIVGMDAGFVLDDSHTYKLGERTSACGNPCASIAYTRYGDYFTVEASRDEHLGACCGGLIQKHLNATSCCGGSDCCSGDESVASGSCCGGDAPATSSCCGGDAPATSSCCGGDAPATSSCCGGDAPASSSCCEPASTSSSCCGDSGSSSCCGGDTENDCCDPEAAMDEPNMERKKTVLIDYLYLDQSVCDRCQGTDQRVFAAVDILRPVMDMAGYNLVVNRVEIENEYLAQRFEFASSPTVRVNGVDICPEIIENECGCCRTLSSYDVYCRQFAFNDKLYEVPPVAYVVKRILEIVLGDEKPSGEPFVMPENIRGFLREKYDQSTARPAE